MSFYEKNMLKHEAINVKTVMINHLRFWDYFLNQDRKSLYFQLLTYEKHHSNETLSVCLQENKNILKLQISTSPFTLSNN